MNKMEIEYQEESLADVLAYFVKGFTPKDGKRVVQYKAFIDQTQGVVVFKLMLETINP